jgi:hypothetical protein
MLKTLLRHLTLGVLFPLPPGMTADRAAAFGLFGLMSNANAASENLLPITTAGTNSNLTGAQVANGAILLAAGASGGFTITLPSTATIIAALGPTIPVDGTFSMRFSIINNGVGQTGTLTAGDASTTINGTATVATNTCREFFMTVNSATTVTFQNKGTAAL